MIAISLLEHATCNSHLPTRSPGRSPGPGVTRVGDHAAMAMAAGDLRNADVAQRHHGARQHLLGNGHGVKVHVPSIGLSPVESVGFFVLTPLLDVEEHCSFLSKECMLNTIIICWSFESGQCYQNIQCRWRFSGCHRLMDHHESAVRILSLT